MAAIVKTHTRDFRFDFEKHDVCITYRESGSIAARPRVLDGVLEWFDTQHSHALVISRILADAPDKLIVMNVRGLAVRLVPLTTIEQWDKVRKTFPGGGREFRSVAHLRSALLRHIW